MNDEEIRQRALEHQAGVARIAAAEQAARAAVMQAAAREELERDLATLKRLGVQSFKGAGIDVVFFAAESFGIEKPPKPADSPDICAGCKHPLFAHTNGACVEGCDVEMCKPKAGA